MTTLLAQRLAATLAAILAVSAPGFAAAQSASTDAPVSITVKYSDLNLNAPAGAQTLMRRIDTAATQACGGQPDSRELGERARFDKCHSAAVEQTMHRFSESDLAALAHSKAQTEVVAGR